MSVSIWDILNDVSFEKADLFNSLSEEDQKVWQPYIVNMMLSYHADSIMIVNELNARYNMSKKAHHDYLFHKLTKRKRFAKPGKETFSDELKLVAEVFDLTETKAKDILSFFDEKDLEEMRKSLVVGGFDKKSKKKDSGTAK